MAEHKNGGLDRRSLAEMKSKRLEEALSAYTPEQTKEAVSKLLEAYTDDGKNYFGAGTRDTTLYFADDEYIREIEKEKAADAKAKEAEIYDEPEKEKSSFVGKLHKLKAFITADDGEVDEEASDDKKPHNEDDSYKTLPDIREVAMHEAEAPEDEDDKPEEEEAIEENEAIDVIEEDEAAEEAVAEVEDKAEDIPEESPVSDSKNIPESETQNDVPAKTLVPKAAKKPEESVETQIETDEPEKEDTPDEPGYEPTIVIKPVKAEDIEKAEKTEEDAEEMRREFFDNEIEVDEVPRRRRKHNEPAPKVEEVNEPEPEYEDEEIDEDYEDDEYEDDYEEKKSKFGGFFSRKKKDDFYDDEDDFDDEDFDDDEYYDDDDYDEGIFTVGRVVNILIIIALICSTAFFAASNYTNSKKLESANTQINELNNGNAAGGADEQINQLKAQIDTLTAENARLKSGGAQTGTTPAAGSGTSTNGTTPTTPVSTTISGTAPAEETDSSSNTPSSGSTYTIKAGDTGSKICNAVYGQYTPELWDKILSANNMTTSTVYHPGDVLQIP